MHISDIIIPYTSCRLVIIEYPFICNWVSFLFEKRIFIIKQIKIINKICIVI